MTRVLYVDAIGGVAGDMLLGALIDAGADAGEVEDGLRRVGAGALSLRTERVDRGGIASCHATIVAEESPARARGLREIRELIDGAALGSRVAERSHAVFAALAAAEGAVHGISAEEVHFHEVGALDAIGDVCGIALALESLAVDELCCSPLPMPRGFVASAHGALPLPAPATLELLRGAPLHGVDLDAELVTPTGAAVLAGLRASYGALPSMTLDAIGYGAGAREFDALPNVTRVLIGERVAAGADPAVAPALLIETNLDDLSPELVPDAAERCFSAGALDVWVTPVQMKKGRPGVVLAALARPADERAVAEMMLRETTALGVRVSPVWRWELERRSVTVDVDGEPVRVKLGLLDGETINAAPEHDDCRAVARRVGRPVKDIWAAALAAASREVVG
jgi:hypothetical protein